jgi:hypothetical protein
MRLLINYVNSENKNEETLIGFENPLNNQINFADNIINISNNFNFFNPNIIYNKNYNNFIMASNYYIFDEINNNYYINENNSFNFIFDLINFYLTLLNDEKINNVLNYCKLKSIMINFRLKYIIKDSYILSLSNPDDIYNINWNNTNNTNIFEENNKYYTFMYQFTDENDNNEFERSNFDLWREVQNDFEVNNFNYNRIIKTTLIDNNLLLNKNNKYGPQFINKKLSTGQNSLYGVNDINSIDVRLFRKLFKDKLYNSILYYIDEEEILDVINYGENSLKIFEKGLNK